MTRITVVGSINLDFVATAATLPAPGETVTGASLARYPGGKGANQALAAQRLGADVALIGQVGADSLADEALALLNAGGVDLSGCATDVAEATGVALIAVAAGGENQIIVAPGANASFTPERLSAVPPGALICQLELPLTTAAKAVALAQGFVCLNLAPAAALPHETLARADLIVVNETEAAFYGEALHALPGLLAITWGARGAGLFQGRRQIAAAPAPPVRAVDTTGAGDAFVAAITLALLEDQTPAEALAFACAAGALSATQPGAQSSLPTRSAVQALMKGSQ